MKLFYRILWLIAVIFGGLSLVKVAVELLDIQNKHYIDV
jgi:hypothetical protein